MLRDLRGTCCDRSISHFKCETAGEYEKGVFLIFSAGVKFICRVNVKKSICR